MGLGPQSTTAITPVIPSKVPLEFFQEFPLENPVGFPKICYPEEIQRSLKGFSFV